ncbi:major facilitator superfamily domain-containing protein [Infundibulicybe gibba]|nr:major facilitator superfamily domain-containing protein [Infundibulicybe gibba]
MVKATSQHSASTSELEKNPDINAVETRTILDDAETTQLEKTVWWKIDICILPVVTMFYLLNWLDRTNLGNARVAGVQKDLKMTNTQRLSLNDITSPYLAAEIPSNLLLKVHTLSWTNTIILGPNVMLPALLTCWGLLQCFKALLVCRFFIGLLEGGVLPGLILYLSFFYPRRRLQSRISAFFSSASLSGAFSGLLATGIMKMGGRGGGFTVLFGLVSFFIFPRSPAHARFLKPHEREYVIATLREDGAISKEEANDGFSWAEVRKTFKLPQFWFLFVVYFLNGTIVFSLGYFTPSIVQGLGYSPIRTQLMTVGPYAFAFVLTNVASFLADRYRCRGFVAIFCAVCCTVGFTMFLVSNSKSVLYGSLFLTIGGINCSSPALGAWVANNVAPHVRRATALAALAMITNVGGIFSTWLMGFISPGPRYTSATITLLTFSVVMGLFIAMNLFYLYKQNKRKEVIRKTTQRSEEAEGLGDRSAWYEYIL